MFRERSVSVSSGKLLTELSKELERRVPLGDTLALGSTKASRQFGRRVQTLRCEKGLDYSELGGLSELGDLTVALVELGLATEQEITEEVVNSLVCVLGDELRRFKPTSR